VYTTGGGSSSGASNGGARPGLGASLTKITQFWRRWVPGTKHGIARGVAVWGSPGFQKAPGQLADLLAECRKVRAWAEEHGFRLDGSPESLSALDETLDRFADQQTASGLANEAGLYLGTVLIRHDDGARWKVWPNGHPVVRMPSGHDLDVVAIVNDASRTGKLELAKHYADAIAGGPS
jgi:hypothetical protein